MRRATRSLVVCSVLLAACGGGGSSAPPPPATGSVQLNNASTHAIDQAYLSATTSPTWGPQRNSSPILAGASFTVSGVAPDFYDARAVVIGALSSYYADAWNFQVVAGQTYLLTAYDSSFSGTVTVTNANATLSQTQLYLKPAGTSTWSPNLLSSAILPGAARQIRGVPPGYWDLMCVRSDAASMTALNFLVSSFSVTPVTCS